MIKYEENEKQRAHELELQKIRGATSNPSHVTVAVDTTRPLPFCDTDDITAYLVRFEKVAVSLNWERKSWSVQLASLLRGKALDIYTSLSDDVTSDYASLKEALLKGFKKTSDWYRTAFKTAKMDSKSTYEQYLNMLFRNFDLWINSLSVTKDYEVLRNIIVCDQFMSTLPKEMRLFLKERKPRTPEDYSSLADTYASAHKCYPKDEQKSFRHNANLSSSSDKISASEKPEKTSSSRPGKIACYGCGQSGHISRNCPNKVPKKKSESSLEIGQVLDNTGVCGPMVCGIVNGVTVSTILRDTEPFDISIDHESFLREQQNCKALKYAREMSQSGDVKRCKNGLQYEFVMRNGLLYRKIQKCKKPQLLGKEQVAIDLVGPISPPSEAGHRYILTMVDYASSFPEAVALKNITSEDIAEALISIFSRVGVPKEILSDRGPQFRSELMLQVHKLLGVKPLFSTPYHPAANGRIERQHQILKSILKKICVQKDDLRNLCQKYKHVFSDKPGKTSLQEHNIKIKTTEPFVRKYYPIPAHLTKDFDDEVQSLLDLGIIEQSSSNYSYPALLVKKKEGNYRLVVDFRTLSAITDFDCEPMPSFEQDLHKFTDFMYITELDICKAYHQIPLTPESRKYTAFSTNLGLMQYVRLPFGLSTACATYIRLMRQVLKGLSFVVCYFDNIFIVSKDWKIHMADLETVILRLQEAGLTAKPGKCFLGYEEIQYLGYVINKRGIFPQQDKIGAILDMPAPTTKKQLRSFIGSVNFYGRFIPNLSDKLIHLTKFLKKGSSEKFNFDEDALCKFNELKSCLTSPPILQVPDLNNIFCLRTDASSTEGNPNSEMVRDKGREETEVALSKMKKGKATELDEILVEVWKCLEEFGVYMPFEKGLEITGYGKRPRLEKSSFDL
ncbi:uncharacterized protein [Palaemon carinicauda]|uniref:uncharacterized protein n=1 Tax=Palaemon carinicauda TaxID=392227 RepID=UPI0035B68B55